MVDEWDDRHRVQLPRWGEIRQRPWNADTGSDDGALHGRLVVYPTGRQGAVCDDNSHYKQ
jgi:hypothetical protein